MPIQSRWSVPIPHVSIPTYVFGSPMKPLPNDRVTLADASRPESHFLTLETWRQWAKRIAVGLRQAGLNPGDRVMIFSGNRLLFPAVFMGVLMAEGIFTGANPTYKTRELAHQLRDCGATFLLTADENGSLETALEAAAQIGFPQENIFVFDDGSYDGEENSRLGIRSWNTLIASEAEGANFFWRELESTSATTACLNYSSGTTGLSKGVQISHYNYVANTTQVLHLSWLCRDFEELNKNGRWLCYLPMYHAMAQAIYIMNAPARSIPVYIMMKYDFIKMLENIQKFKITELALVPPIAVSLAKNPASRKYDLSSVRKIICGAAPLGREVSVEVESLWNGKVNLKQGWGMTELTCSFLGWDPTLWSEDASVGELNANCEARIMNDEGTAEVKPGERGELWVRGPNVMQGYWRNDKATTETLSDCRCWLKTGDICYINKRGHFNVVDRKKELIKVKGNQVAPAELEAILLEHPDVSDSAVIGVYLDGGEVPRAYIIPKEGRENKVDPNQVASWLASKVAKHKRLDGGVCIVDEIPKNPSGKILRKILRERAAKEVADSNPIKARL